MYCDANKDVPCGCKTVPCVNPARTFAKNHDFGLRTSPGVPILAAEHYLVQYRNPVRSIVSNYYLYIKNHPHECERADWESFALREVFYWNKFIDKWVLDYPEDAAAPLYCTYESLIAEPEARLREILTFLSDGPLDDRAAARIIGERPIAPRNNLAAFKFHDPVFFDELEAAASQRLAELDLPSWDDGV